MKTLALVFLGGGLGSVVRYVFSLWFVLPFGKWFPMATFMANIVSCFILGMVLKKLAGQSIDAMTWHFLLVTGFCGGFSTFSTLSLEVLNLIKMNLPGQAMAYIVISVLSGLGFLWIGLRV